MRPQVAQRRNLRLSLQFRQEAPRDAEDDLRVRQRRRRRRRGERDEIRFMECS